MAAHDTGSGKTQYQMFDFTSGSNTIEPGISLNSLVATFFETGTVPKYLGKHQTLEARNLEVEAIERNTKATDRRLYERLQELDIDLDVRTELRTVKSEHEDRKNQLAEARVELKTAREARDLMEAKHLREIALLERELEQVKRESEGRRLELWALGYRNRLLLKEMAVQKATMSERLSQEAKHSFHRESKHSDQRARVSSAHEELERAEAEIRRLVKELLASREQSTELQDRTVRANTPDPTEIKHSNGCAAPAAVGVVDKCSTPQRFIRDLRISVDRYMRFSKVSIMDDFGPGKLSCKCFSVAVQDAVELQRVLPDVIRAARLVAEEMADF